MDNENFAGNRFTSANTPAGNQNNGINPSVRTNRNPGMGSSINPAMGGNIPNNMETNPANQPPVTNNRAQQQFTNGYERYADGSSNMFGFHSPQQQNFNTAEMRGSMQQIFSQNIGEYVVVEFLIGTERIMRKQGILYFVGTSFVTLYDDVNETFIVCDIFSVKFAYFYYPGDRPSFNFNLLFDSDLPPMSQNTNNMG